MKKVLFFATVAAMVLTTMSCNKKEYKADLRTDIDTLSYEYGVGTGSTLSELMAQLEVDTLCIDEMMDGVSEGIKALDKEKKSAYIVGMFMNLQGGLGPGSQLKQMMQQMGIDTAYVDHVIDGYRDFITIQNNAKKKAHAVGEIIGWQTAMGVNQSILFGQKDYKLSENNFIAGLLDGHNHNYKIFDPTTGREKFQSQAEAIQAKIKNIIKKENEDYLTEYAKQNGVKKLPSGVLFKVLKEGKGPKPTPSSDVTVRYEGRTIDGTVFDSNMEGSPAVFSPSEVVPGFGEALLNMPEGSKWEVCIPQKLAYGEQTNNPKIKPFSTLIFKIEVVKVGAASVQQSLDEMPLPEGAVVQQPEEPQQPQQPEEPQPAPQPEQ